MDLPRDTRLPARVVVLFALLAVVERRSAAPLVDPSLVVSRSLVWTNLATLVISVGMFAAVTLLPRFVQAPVASGYGFGYSRRAPVCCWCRPR
jgi:hypothetical protein